MVWQRRVAVFFSPHDIGMVALCGCAPDPGRSRRR
jgi:hypothetical protein